MKTITREMIEAYNIVKLGYDFMGYEVTRKSSLSFHHLIVPKRLSKSFGIGDGYKVWNGAILMQETSHDYLHIIETIDRDVFLAITKEMIFENELGRLDVTSLRRIRDILLYFECEHYDDTNSKGKPFIREEYITRRLKL